MTERHTRDGERARFGPGTRQVRLLPALGWRLLGSVLLCLALIPFYERESDLMMIFPAETPTVTEMAPGEAADQGHSNAEAARSLIARYGCWTGDAPADMEGKFPGHAVVTTPNGETVYSADWVGPALEHVFDGKYPRLVPHAFCR